MEVMNFGFPRMRVEAGERRDYLPEYIGQLEELGAHVALEEGYGSGMGFNRDDYRAHAPQVRFVSHEEAYKQDYVFVLRCPDTVDLQLLTPGACLISMLHYPTRPGRTAFIKSLGVECISLDSLTDDQNQRLVENLRAVAWNGIQAAFETLQEIYPEPGFQSPDRSPIRVTLLGSGAVGVHVVQASVRYGNNKLWGQMARRGVPGVIVSVVDYDTSSHKDIMLKLLGNTDILVDATQRPDPSKAVIPNEWIAVMPMHAVLVDLSVDPYDLPAVVKGIEGIPGGNLSKFVFTPDDEDAYLVIPSEIPTTNRRHAVSCYSWPGVKPRECMQVYGAQLAPIFRTIIELGGVGHIDPDGTPSERAIARAKLSRWK